MVSQNQELSIKQKIALESMGTDFVTLLLVRECTSAQHRYDVTLVPISA